MNNPLIFIINFCFFAFLFLNIAFFYYFYFGYLKYLIIISIKDRNYFLKNLFNFEIFVDKSYNLHHLIFLQQLMVLF